MGMAAILFNDAEPFEQLDDIPSTECPMWNLVKTGQAAPEKKTFKNYKILYSHVHSPGAREDNPGGQNFDCN